MKALKVLTLAALPLLPALGYANTETTRCFAAHFVRGPGGNEIHFTAVFFNNGGQYPAVIERLTIRDDHGNALHDSGPKIGVAHPLHRAPIPPQDFTTVPPGGTFAFATTDLWGFNEVPQYAGTGIRSLSVTVEVSTPGDPKHVVVHTREIARERTFPAPGVVGMGAERGANDTACFRVEELRN